MPPTTFSLQVPSAKINTRNDSSGGGLGTDDIIGIAVGIPSALLALIGVVIAYLTYKKPGKLENVKKRLYFGGNWAQGDVSGGQHYMTRGPTNHGTIETQNISN
ncbi:hypothetical protein ANO14919_068530 [Xylariales sp. No.14919]|nr:hypothetical protein ANO14919_068530 [Xylariales sp. No.14919]